MITQQCSQNSNQTKRNLLHIFPFVYRSEVKNFLQKLNTKKVAPFETIPLQLVKLFSDYEKMIFLGDLMLQMMNIT